MSLAFYYLFYLHLFSLLNQRVPLKIPRSFKRIPVIFTQSNVFFYKFFYL